MSEAEMRCSQQQLSSRWLHYYIPDCPAAPPPLPSKLVFCLKQTFNTKWMYTFFHLGTSVKYRCLLLLLVFPLVIMCNYETIMTQKLSHRINQHLAS